MQSNTRFFQNDLEQATYAASQPIPESVQREPAAVQSEGDSLYRSKDYADLTIGRAKESVSLIQNQAEGEVQGILQHIERLKSEFEIESRAINERIAKKQRILSHLENLEISFGNDMLSKNPASIQTEELYQNLNNKARKLSILTSIFLELQGISDNSNR